MTDKTLLQLLEDQIEIRKARRIQLREESARLDEEIQDLVKARNRLRTDSAAHPDQSERHELSSAPIPPSRTTLADVAEEVLRSVDAYGLHVNRILAAITERGLKVTTLKKEMTAEGLSDVLYAWSRRGQRFRRVGPNMYALRTTEPTPAKPSSSPPSISDAADAYLRRHGPCPVNEVAMAIQNDCGKSFVRVRRALLSMSSRSQRFARTGPDQSHIAIQGRDSDEPKHQRRRHDPHEPKTHLLRLPTDNLPEGSDD